MQKRYRTNHNRLSRVCFNDYDREICLVAEQGGSASRRTIVGIARLTRVRDPNEAEFAIIISDNVHNRGLGTELLNRLLAVAKSERLPRVSADVLRANSDMLQLCRRTGFTLSDSLDSEVVRVVQAIKD